MKRINVSAKIVRVSPVSNPDGSPVYRNDRLITHRAILESSPSFESALKACAALKRNPEPDGTIKVVAFCLKRDDGKYAVDLNANQMQLLTGGRVSPHQFQFIAPGCTFNATVELRALGDTYIDRVSGEEREIGAGNGVNQFPGNAHAAIVDITSTIPVTTEAAIIQAMFAPAPVVTLAQPAPSILHEVATERTVAIGEDDDVDMQLGEDAPEAEVDPNAGKTKAKSKATVTTDNKLEQ